MEVSSLLILLTNYNKCGILIKMLIIGETGYRGMGTLYYLCNFPINLKLF